MGVSVSLSIVMSQDEVKKVKLKVKCRAIDETELLFDQNDKVSPFCQLKEKTIIIIDDKIVSLTHYSQFYYSKLYSQPVIARVSFFVVVL